MRIVAICLSLWASAIWASAGALQGTIKDSRGHPIKGAEIRIEGKTGSKAIKSDAKGHYSSEGLVTDTDYKVTLSVNGSVKASLLNVRAGAEKPAELNFDLCPANRFSNKHMVWIPDQPIGTHVGAGHWAEADENGRIIERNNMDVARWGSEYARHVDTHWIRTPENGPWTRR